MPPIFSSFLSYNVLIETLIIIILLFSPLIYGGITALPIFIIESLSLLLIFLFLFNNLLKEKFSLIKIPIIPISLFIILILLQLTNLPSPVIYSFSPHTFLLYKNFRDTPPAFANLSIYPETSLHHLLQFLSYLMIFLVVSNYLDSRKKINRLTITIIIIGFLYALYGILTNDYSQGSIGFSTFTNRNHFAAYLEMVLFLSIGYIFIDTSKSNRIIITFFASVILLALFLTASRAARLSFILGLVVFIFLLKTKKTAYKTVSTLIILLLFFILWIATLGPQIIIQRLETFNNPLQAYAGRFEMLKDSLHIIKDFPLFGTGLGTFKEIAQKYKTVPWQVTYAFAHNELIQILVETGILGCLLILWFLFTYFKNIFFLWQKRNLPFSVYITLGGFCGLFTALTHSFFDFIFHVPAVIILFFVILALIFKAVYLKESWGSFLLPRYEFKINNILKFFLIFILFLSLIFMEMVIYRRYQAERLFEKIKDRKLLQNGIEGVLEHKKNLNDIEKIIALNPLNSLYFSKKADLLTAIVLNQEIKEGLLLTGVFKNNEEILAQAQNSYKRAIGLNPTCADYHLHLGWFYDILNKPELAMQEFKKALLLDPQNNNIKTYIDNYLKSNNLYIPAAP